ncbi:MAG: YceD family protein [Flavobacteriales bacterium]
MEKLNKYKIPFVGLKEGKHEFEFSMNNEFFEQYDYDYIDNVELSAKVSLHKMSTMMILDFSLSGNYDTQCDLCGDDLRAISDSEHSLYAKFGEGESTDENILMVPQKEHEINVADLIFEFFVTTIPLKHEHEEGKCNEEVIDKLSTYKIENTEQESNPIWDKLKDLK